MSRPLTKALWESAFKHLASIARLLKVTSTEMNESTSEKESSDQIKLLAMRLSSCGTELHLETELNGAITV